MLKELRSCLTYNTQCNLKGAVQTMNKEICRDCVYLVEGEDHSWICDDWGVKIEDVPEHPEYCYLENTAVAE